MNLAKFARRGYVDSPTPIEFLPRLSKALGGKVNIYIKRDDLLPGCAGGNKARKLDFCLAKAMAEGADTLITCGAIQSNHCRLTLAWAVKEGLDCHLVLTENNGKSYRSDASGNVFLFHLMGATSIRLAPANSSTTEEMNKLADELRAKGKKPYILPVGGSTPTGALGYAACAQECLEQLFRMGLDIHSMVVPCGSAGTQAGLILGLSGSNAGIPVIGMSVVHNREQYEVIARDLVLKGSALLGLKQEIVADQVICEDGYLGPGYSLPSPEMVEAVRLVARTEAILLDPVYTGKAMAGLIDYVRKGRFPDGSNVLFLHTGGTPALYAYLDAFQ